MIEQTFNWVTFYHILFNFTLQSDSVKKKNSHLKLESNQIPILFFQNTEVNEDVERVDDELKMNEDIGKNLVFNVETGIVMDRITGRKFRLQPVYS